MNVTGAPENLGTGPGTYTPQIPCFELNVFCVLTIANERDSAKERKWKKERGREKKSK